MLNQGVPKCHEDLITLETQVQQGKQWITRQSEMADLARRGNTFRWLMTLTFDLKFWKYLSVTEKSYSMCMSSFMMIGWEMAEILHIEISWKHVSVTYDLWPKILKIFVSHRVPILNEYVKFHDDRLRNDWDITHWNFAETRTHRHGHYNTSPSPYGGRGNKFFICENIFGYLGAQEGGGEGVVQ